MSSTECPIKILERLAREVRKADYPYGSWVADGVVLATVRLQKHGFKKEPDVVFKPRLNPNQLNFLPSIGVS